MGPLANVNTGIGSRRLWIGSLVDLRAVVHRTMLRSSHRTWDRNSTGYKKSGCRRRAIVQRNAYDGRTRDAIWCFRGKTVFWIYFSCRCGSSILDEERSLIVMPLYNFNPIFSITSHEKNPVTELLTLTLVIWVYSKTCLLSFDTMWLNYCDWCWDFFCWRVHRSSDVKMIEQSDISV